MAGNQLSITNVVNVSVSLSPLGLGEFNNSNIALFTREVPNESYGDDGFKIYVDPIDVATDFGSSSETYLMALGIFSQQPNILANNGYLTVILYEDTDDVVAEQLISFPSVPTSGSYKLKYGSETSAAIAWDDTDTDVQTALQALTGLASVTVDGDTTDGFTVVFTGVSGPASLLEVVENSLQDAGPFDVFPTVETTVVGTTLSTETLAAAITRTVSLVQYFAIMTSEITSQTDMLAAAAVVQALNKMALFVSRTSADIDPGGMLDLLRSGGFYKSRGLYYGVDNDSDALVMMASYAGRGFSTVFSGSNTTATMHLKDLQGVQPDPTMTQTLLNKGIAAGADMYVSIQGVAKVFTSGENRFFDQVYNLGWFVGALEIAGFNFLAQSSTKIPQTEDGMRGLKGAYRQICEQAVTNAYLAPGTWTSATTFGNQEDFLANILQKGYYIFSQPIGQQSPTEREAREAPLVQLAIKEAGAEHSSAVIVNINA